MTTSTVQRRVTAFSKQHFGHYEVRRQLGAGSFGTTFLGFDRRRGVPVCLKFFHDLHAPAGSERDWSITSTLRHPSINDTQAVETFQIDGSEGVVVVSRYQQGVNLGTFLDRVSRVDRLVATPLSEKILAEIGLPLCRVVAFCHSAEHSHGDLHDGNVIVTRPKGDPVLIDFGTATYSIPNRNTAATAASLRREDVDHLKGLIGRISYLSRWRTHYSDVFASCSSASELAEAIQQCLDIVKDIDDHDRATFGESLWHMACRRELAISLYGGRSYGRTFRDFLEGVAADLRVTEELRAAREALSARLSSDPNYPEVSLTVTKNDGPVLEAFQNLLLQPEGADATAPIADPDEMEGSDE